ncbi:hypothetical protein Sviol_51310 [Streptomyces violascens]|uniref:HTH araC/xylS-type domain-containing protein n=1 Tax=Streptomyces violascens TaxID=67381 RepID=A0ABQ3QU06_9ACTN|nr:hypothetical protein Sviol_51310 [Streptomyces violascens]
MECVQVRLSPVIARAILGVSPAELDGTAVPLDDLWGREASRIREQLGEVSPWQDRFALTDTLLARRHEAGPAVDPEVAWVWHRIVSSRGLTRVDGLAAEVGWSRKRLWSRFRSQLGLPPKRAVKLVRFDHAAHRLVAGEGAAQVAADAGYADQSHLHRDVMAFTGAPPPRPWPANGFSPSTTSHGRAVAPPANDPDPAGNITPSWSINASAQTVTREDMPSPLGGDLARRAAPTLDRLSPPVGRGPARARGRGSRQRRKGCPAAHRCPPSSCRRRG